MTITSKTTVLRGYEHYAARTHFVLRNHTSSGIRPVTTTIATRRVRRHGVDEVQMEIEIATQHKTKITSAYGSMSLNAEQADQLIEALTKWRDAIL